MVIAFPLEGGSGQGDVVCVMDGDGANVRYFTDLSREVFVLRWLPEGDSLVAEVTALNASTTDIERIKYPWKDAGASDGGGGDGNGGGGGTGVGWWDDLTGGYGGYLLMAIGVVIVVAIAGTYYRHNRKRERQVAAEDLKRQMEAEERTRWEKARQDIEVRPPSPYGNYGQGYYSRDGTYRYR